MKKANFIFQVDLEVNDIVRYQGDDYRLQDILVVHSAATGRVYPIFELTNEILAFQMTNREELTLIRKNYE